MKIIQLVEGSFFVVVAAASVPIEINLNQVRHIKYSTENRIFIAENKFLVLFIIFIGLFKNEYTCLEQQCLNSKTFILSSVLQDGEPTNDLVKAKGINKHRIENPKQTFSSVLKRQTSVSVVNQGIRPWQQTNFTYSLERIGFRFSYYKRICLPNKMLINKKNATKDGPWNCIGVLTSPLTMTLNPWPREVQQRTVFGPFNALGLGHIYKFKHHGFIFYSLNQALAYRMVVFLKKNSLADQVLEEGIYFSGASRKNIENLLLPRHSLAGFAREEATMECIADKMRGCEETRNELSMIRDTRKTRLVYSDPTDWYYSCGESYSTARLMLEKEFPGTNLLGKLWEKLL